MSCSRHAKDRDGVLMGVSENGFVDGIALETGQAERASPSANDRSLASISFFEPVTKEDFTRGDGLHSGGSKAQDVVKHIKNTFGDNKQATIRINESLHRAIRDRRHLIAAQLPHKPGPEFKEWLHDPQKLLQLIAPQRRA